ncbi:unnamed protein product [Prorocentrum cordatum]|uniref:Zinc finger LSD1-type domain-containing protein n=1 Tax=Prorocentrum cordatum TaxID=2364126 RepID=A0ABN9RFK8_9DINO|nr:unnamed protein product [Polarella glacialis]
MTRGVGRRPLLVGMADGTSLSAASPAPNKLAEDAPKVDVEDRTMNAVLSGNQLGGRTMNMLCTVCQTSNLAPWGTAYVRCGHCNTVSDVTHVYSAGVGVR